MASSEENRKNKIRNILSELGAGFKDSARITPEDRRNYLRWIREREGKAEAPRAHFTVAQQPIIDTLRQIKTVGQNPIVNRIPGITPMTDESLLARGNEGLNIGGVTEFEIDNEADIKGSAARYKKKLAEIGPARKIGYAIGSVVNDAVNDSTRSVYWLLNAPQASTSIAAELGVNSANPDFFDRETLTDLDKAVNEGLLRFRPQVEPNPDFGAAPGTKDYEREMRSMPENYIPGAPGVKYNKAQKTWGRRRYNPNTVNIAAMLPAALAINSGIGLLGRREGYAMTVPSEDDPRSTDNAVAEVAARYILNREGRLLDASDALLERPDLTYGEYQKYKGYLRDREIDLNLFDDGKINIGGILKTNPDGIHGPEVSFMGKTLDVNQTLLPTASTILGSTAAAYATKRLGMSKAANIATLFGGGMAGLAAGNLAGNTLEQERRRRNFQENNPGVDYDTYRQKAADILERKLEIQRQNPNAQQERGESKVGFNKRSQQQALQTKALQQQVLVDQILDEENKARAQKAMGTQQWALDKSAAIDEEIRRRRESQQEEQPATLSL
jgi:hypothetical protein